MKDLEIDIHVKSHFMNIVLLKVVKYDEMAKAMLEDKEFMKIIAKKIVEKMKK